VKRLVGRSARASACEAMNRRGLSQRLARPANFGGCDCRCVAGDRWRAGKLWPASDICWLQGCCLVALRLPQPARGAHVRACKHPRETAFGFQSRSEQKTLSLPIFCCLPARAPHPLRRCDEGWRHSAVRGAGAGLKGSKARMGVQCLGGTDFGTCNMGLHSLLSLNRTTSISTALRLARGSNGGICAPPGQSPL
jgi:hypothetical protein